MSNLEIHKLSFNAKALEETIKSEILIREIQVYPKDIINYYIRKIHFQEEAFQKLNPSLNFMAYCITQFDLD